MVSASAADFVASDADLARLLGVSPAVVCRHKRRGMPTNSAEAARAWRDANLNPALRKDMNPARAAGAPSGAPDSARAALRRLATAMHDGARAVEAGLFPYIADGVRSAMRAVPSGARHRALLHPGVMDALTERAFAALGGDAALPMGDGDAAAMGAFWYAVAAGEAPPRL